MKIKIIDYGYKNLPKRAHYNDAGADVFSLDNVSINPNETKRIPLGFGLELPDGVAAFIGPRSGMSSKGISCELAPIDSGYTGEIHAIVINNTNKKYDIEEGDRIGQLLITPIILSDFINEDIEQRSNNGFGSTGK